MFMYQFNYDLQHARELEIRRREAEERERRRQREVQMELERQLKEAELVIKRFISISPKMGFKAHPKQQKTFGIIKVRNNLSCFGETVTTFLETVIEE